MCRATEVRAAGRSDCGDRCAACVAVPVPVPVWLRRWPCLAGDERWNGSIPRSRRTTTASSSLLTSTPCIAAMRRASRSCLPVSCSAFTASIRSASHAARPASGAEVAASHGPICRGRLGGAAARVVLRVADRVAAFRAIDANLRRCSHNIASPRPAFRRYTVCRRAARQPGGRTPPGFAADGTRSPR